MNTQRRTILGFLIIVAALLLIVAIAATFAPRANGQTVTVEVYAPEMRIEKVRVGLWRCVEEPCEVTLTFPDGKMDAVRVQRKSTVAIIPPTFARGFLFRAVDPCIGQGGGFTMHLPREPIRVNARGQVYAVAIDCPCTWGDYAGSVRFDDCIADPVGLGLYARVARATTAYGNMTLQRK